MCGGAVDWSTRSSSSSLVSTTSSGIGTGNRDTGTTVCWASLDNTPDHKNTTEYHKNTVRPHTRSQEHYRVPQEHCQTTHQITRTWCTNTVRHRQDHSVPYRQLLSVSVNLNLTNISRINAVDLFLSIKATNHVFFQTGSAMWNTLPCDICRELGPVAFTENHSKHTF